MSHEKNKLEWCLKKAEREIAEGNKHRGLVKTSADKEKAKKYIKKAEHYLEASLILKKGFSDIGVSTVFYCIYHCFLAILAKFGYESRNQECTFAVIYSLIEDGKINLDKGMIDKISPLSRKEEEEAIIDIREKYQYETEITLKEGLYEDIFNLAKEILGKTKMIVEEKSGEKEGGK